jgi:hypothetical protein
VLAERRSASRRVLSAVPAALLLALAPASAHADASAADRAIARDLANEGYDALERKDFTTAVERFTRAEALFHVATIALGLARAQAGLGRLLDASETYRRIVAEGAPSGAPPAIARALADARRELDAIAPRLAGIVINVTGSDQPAVTVDGAPVAKAALGLKRPVDPGQHVLRATAPGKAPAETTVNLAEGQSQTVTLELRAAAEAPPPDAPPPPVVAPPAPPPEAPPPPPAASGWPARKTAGVVLMAGGGVAAIVGGALLGAAHGKYSTLNTACPTHKGCSPSLSSDLSSYQALGSASIASFVVAGLALGTGIALFVTAPKPAPAAGSGGAFVTARVGAGRLFLEGGF